MASCRDLSLLLVIVCLLLIRGSSPLPTMSDGSPTRPLTPRLSSNQDFDDYSEHVETTPAVSTKTDPFTGTRKKCDYNPCLESQIPCSNLSVSTGCLCPGSTLHDQTPEAPNIKSVSWNGSEVVVRWCAPYSYVTSYIVTIGGKEKLKLDQDQRSGALGDVENIAQVCVKAVNDAGGSNESCMMYQPRDSSLPLKAGLIGGALGFLLLLLLAVLLWRHRRQRKQEASISMHNTEETQ